jgi:hypothetical protein
MNSHIPSDLDVDNEYDIEYIAISASWMLLTPVSGICQVLLLIHCTCTTSNALGNVEISWYDQEICGSRSLDGVLRVVSIH